MLNEPFTQRVKPNEPFTQRAWDGTGTRVSTATPPAQHLASRLVRSTKRLRSEPSSKKAHSHACDTQQNAPGESTAQDTLGPRTLPPFPSPFVSPTHHWGPPATHCNAPRLVSQFSPPLASPRLNSQLCFALQLSLVVHAPRLAASAHVPGQRFATCLTLPLSRPLTAASVTPVPYSPGWPCGAWCSRAPPPH
eukprot:4217737-Prymnesium_polylepis.1